jgi:hypothetical protein
MIKPKVVLLIFVSGKIVLTGAKVYVVSFDREQLLFMMAYVVILIAVVVGSGSGRDIHGVQHDIHGVMRVPQAVIVRRLDVVLSVPAYDIAHLPSHPRPHGLFTRYDHKTSKTYFSFPCLGSVDARVGHGGFYILRLMSQRELAEHLLKIQLHQLVTLPYLDSNSILRLFCRKRTVVDVIL